MDKTHTTLDEMKLLGITARTNNETEADLMTGKIFPIVQRYFGEGLGETILNRKTPGTTYCAYTDYESDHNGDYTYFIGEEVMEFPENAEGLERLTIPAQKYAKFTNGPAPMPNVIRDAWFKIWDMNEGDFGGKRVYKTDFEVYDERAVDHEKIVLDILIGIEG